MITSMSENANKKTTKTTNGTNRTQPKNNNRKNAMKKAMKKEDNLRKGLKNSSGFMFGLFVNILIVFLIVKLFTYAFNFAYAVFGEVANHPGSQEYIVVDIPADSTIMEIGEALQDADIIEDKYVFYAKVKVKGYGTKISNGKFHLSSGMTYDEILKILCNIQDKTDEDSD